MLDTLNLKVDFTVDEEGSIVIIILPGLFPDIWYVPSFEENFPPEKLAYNSELSSFSFSLIIYNSNNKSEVS